MKTFTAHKTTRDTVLEHEPVPAIIDKPRVMANKETLRALPEPDDNALPEIVTITDAAWDALERPRNSKYSMYDNIAVGEAIVGLPAKIANTVFMRLKKKGYNLQQRKLDDNSFAIKRTA